MNENEKSMLYAEKLSEMVRFETISEYGERDKSKFYAFREILKKLFPNVFAATELEDFDGTFLLKWKGKSDKNPFLFMNHHDVVEGTGKWSHEPFGGEIDDGKIWGRGTLDTKGGLFCMLQSAEELICDGFVPERDIYFESSCNEETDGSGCQSVAAALLGRGIRFDLVLDEGGMIVDEPIAGAKGKFAMIGVGEKGCADVKFIARSAGGHASTPPKNTPLVRLGKFMCKVEKSNLFTVKVSDVVREMFVRLSPHIPGALKYVLGHPKFFDLLIRKVMPAVSPTAAAMLRTTVAFTTAKGSEGLNVIPQEAYVTGNIRFSHHQGGMSSLDALRKVAKKYDVETEIIDPGVESRISDFRREAFRLVESATQSVYPDVPCVPYVMTGASDARYLDVVSDDCIRFVPFPISDKQLESIHGVDECVDIGCLPKAVDFYKFIMKNA